MNSQKALMQLFGAVVAAVLPLLMTDGDLSVTEWINVGVVGAGAVSVWLASNDLPAPWNYTKFFFSALAAGGVMAISVLGDGVISQPEWFQIVAAVLTALGVYQVENGAIGKHRRAG